MKKLQTTIFRYTSRWGEAGMEFSEHFCPPLPHEPRTQCVHFLRLKQKTQDPNQPWSLGKISDCHFFWSSLMVCFYLCFSWTFVGQYLLLGGQKNVPETTRSIVSFFCSRRKLGALRSFSSMRQKFLMVVILTNLKYVIVSRVYRSQASQRKWHLIIPTLIGS